MGNLVQEYRELLLTLVDLDFEDGDVIPAETAARMNVIERQFDCKCCGKKSPGRWSVWPNCLCARSYTCDDCKQCYRCCNCTSRAGRIGMLKEEAARRTKLIGEAHDLAVRVGLEELSEEHTLDDVCQLEKELTVKLLAVTRLLRRQSGWEHIASQLRYMGEEG